MKSGSKKTSTASLSRTHSLWRDQWLTHCAWSQSLPQWIIVCGSGILTNWSSCVPTGPSFDPPVCCLPYPASPVRCWPRTHAWLAAEGSDSAHHLPRNLYQRSHQWRNHRHRSVGGFFWLCSCAFQRTQIRRVYCMGRGNYTVNSKMWERSRCIIWSASWIITPGVWPPQTLLWSAIWT